MSAKSGCKDCPDASKAMSRSQFLGTGAALAAVAGVGGVSAELAAQDGPCTKDPANCPAANESWTINASVLNIFWAEIWPRLVARGWENWEAANPDFGIPDGNVSPAQLKAAIENLIASASSNGTPFGPEFIARANLVTGYLSPGPNHIPISFRGHGEFDFILSDHGLDLFAPKWPAYDRDVWRFYRFRRTGRPTIGIPEYLVDTHAFDVDAPRGPGQIYTTLTALGASINEEGCTVEDTGACLEFSEVEDEFDVLPDDQFRPPQRLWQQMRRFDYQGFLAAAGKARCWQLQGSVYRGILNELPRVVATIWVEDIDSFTGDTSYTRRFSPTPPNADDVAEIFRERLETSLPRSDRMVFEVVKSNPALSDVTISNRGLSFPAVPTRIVGGVERPIGPDKAAMFKAMALERVGNPVFTDSKRPGI